MTSGFALVAPRIFDGDTWHDSAALIVENGQAKAIVPADQLPQGMACEHFAKGVLAPGFVDLQVNGGGGVLFNNDPSVAGIHTICTTHAKFGTTALLPTLITDTPQVRDTALAAGIEAAQAGVPGFAGLHLEGPHLSLARKGAHDPALIRPMTDADVAALIKARPHLPALITTVAAESVTPAQVQSLAQAGVKICIGHSEATIAQVEALTAAGATMITHLFNAMSQMTGREPGMVGAALASGALSAGLIADGYHVHPASMQVAIRGKAGPGRIFLVSDAMSTVGTDVTAFELNGRTIYRANGKLTLEDGTLAGADLELATAVRLLHQTTGIELGEVLRMAALYPAHLIDAADMGQLKPGHKANIVWLDEDLSPERTWIAGESVN